MEKSADYGDLQCVGRLEIVRPKPVGFICGSLPVPTDKAFHVIKSALVPSPHTVQAPPLRYQMIPTETNLNTLPLLSSTLEKVIPVAATQLRSTGDLSRETNTITSNLTRKGEALAVSGLVDSEDDIDVIASTDILKQIFKIPYSKARLSIAVHRVGQTLVLNTGPDVEEGEKLVRRNNNPQKCTDQSLFLNFAMHSVRMEACDCPPTYTSQKGSDSAVHHQQFEPTEVPTKSFKHSFHGNNSYMESDSSDRDKGSRSHSKYKSCQRDLFLGKKKIKRPKGHDAAKVSQVKEMPRSSVKESEKNRRCCNDKFSRVLFWQFHSFRMLLGSDLLIFSNEKYVAVSLHLWDVSQKVTPLIWLEAWLDNIMASIPELAICYHQDGVVQGYELLKTDDISLLKGISEDGLPAFYPQVVEQNGLSVLRFLQDNCKKDPCAYWLYKSAGEDAVQLFDLSVIPNDHPSDDYDDSSSSLPSLIHKGRSSSLLSLGTLLYRIAHRLSLSMSSKNWARCKRLLEKCIDFLEDPDHQVIRGLAHEQFARLLLTCNENLEVLSEPLPLESEVVITDTDKEDSVHFFTGISELRLHEKVPLQVSGDQPSGDAALLKDFKSGDPVTKSAGNLASCRILEYSSEMDAGHAAHSEGLPSTNDARFEVDHYSESTSAAVQDVSDPVRSKLAAIHHVSQAIKALGGWNRQRRTTNSKLDNGDGTEDDLPLSVKCFVCACGDPDCIEVCDIREWLPTSKLDDKLWKLVLLLGESYLALGEAYKDGGQLYETLKCVELACFVYGSMPQYREETMFVSSIGCSSLTEEETDNVSENVESVVGDCAFAYKYLFWAKAWALVGDVYAKLHPVGGKDVPLISEEKCFVKKLKMSSEVQLEVERLKQKFGQFTQNCSSCSLMNCSCQSERTSSGSSASCSSRTTGSLAPGRRQNKRSHAKSNSCHHAEHFEGETGVSSTESNRNASLRQVNDDGAIHMQSEASKVKNGVKGGGIFKYIRDCRLGDTDFNLSHALKCYKEARKALAEHPSNLKEVQSLIRKEGWVCNELGRRRLERNELDKAEIAFAQAINAFKEVSDHTNIILINCNLGHGRRALAEDMVSKIDTLKKHAMLHDAYKQALETAKSQYSESLRYYGAAKAELNTVAEGTDSISISLQNEVHTQLAHTYLRFGMLLAREDTTASVQENYVLEDYVSSRASRCKRNPRKHEISANEAIREALSVYESLGELRKQEAAYAYFQLACYQRDCCLKFLEQDQSKAILSKGEISSLQKVKQYASLAERNWQKSMDFYGPKSHPLMYLTILVERGAFSMNLSSSLHSNMQHLESAVSRMLEARHLSENTTLDCDNGPEICARFWSQLQMLLKRLLSVTLSTSANKPSAANIGKLKELYKMSLKCAEFKQLAAMYNLWVL
ncbi:hypothetical protein DM860_001416 [Cuscuta australis]|uniref:EDRF1 N-terminal domain-containing protein n=1 Tax=Cuscuta australis TaxID=267555 RepID=A0A328EC82_9ASTE|nr:hypothetical protein DM860_001416 [Cuscuta australis]